MNESGNPKADGWQMMPNYEAFMLQGHQKSSFLFSFLFLALFCRFAMLTVVLQWSGFGELVLVMERNPCCLIDNLYGECES
jgi:hypothetical protein